MNRKIKPYVDALKKGAVAKGPALLTGVGIVGMITTTITAVGATPKAMILIAERAENLGVEPKDVPTIDVVKVSWRCYIRSIILGCVSIGCLIGANTINAKRQAALAAAYALADSTLSEYQSKVIETIGAKKEDDICTKIAQDKIAKHPVGNDVIITEKGDTLCYDVTSDRYFKSDIDKLRRAVNDLNRLMRDEMYISLNDFYEEIGLKPIQVGDDLGWNIDRGYIDLHFDAILTDDGTPCIAISFYTMPKYNYNT